MRTETQIEADENISQNSSGKESSKSAYNSRKTTTVPLICHCQEKGRTARVWKRERDESERDECGRRDGQWTEFRKQGKYVHGNLFKVDIGT